MWRAFQGRQNNHLQKAIKSLHPSTATLFRIRRGALTLFYGDCIIRFLLSHLFSLRLIVLALGLVIALTGVALPVFQLIDHTLLSALWGTPASGSNPVVAFPGNGFNAYLQQHHVRQPIWIAPATNAALIAILALLTLVIPGLKAIQKDPAKRLPVHQP